jgi:hypothetical protein
MTALHTLGILSTSITWNAFPNCLEGVPTYAKHLLAAFLHSAVRLIPNHLKFGCGRGIVQARSSDSVFHHTGVLGHCPVEKQMIVPLSANQMGWRIAAECSGIHAVVSMLVKCALNYK